MSYRIAFPDTPAGRAHLRVAQKRFWRLNGYHHAELHPGFYVSFFGLVILWLPSWFIPASVLFNPYNSGILTFVTQGFVVALTVAFIWAAIGGIGLLNHIEGSAGQIISTALAALVSPVLVFLMAGSVVHRTIPMVAAIVAGSEMQVERSVHAVRSGKICIWERPGRCFGRSSKYHTWVMIDGHPDLSSRIITTYKFRGFDRAASPGTPQEAIFVGRGTALGMIVYSAHARPLEITSTD